MSLSTPENIDAYIAQQYGHEHDNTMFATALSAMKAADLPSINVSASEGMLLNVLTRAIAAKRILEIGSLGGYSGLWFASALPHGGKLVTLEIDSKHAGVAQACFDAAGFSDRTEVILGPALESLDRLIRDAVDAFDIVFIDADKPAYPQYLERAKKLVRRGGLILADNTLTHGALDPNADTGITQYNRAVAESPELTSAIIPTMRDDIDGLTVSVFRG